jgi:hypothetical protein
MQYFHFSQSSSAVLINSVEIRVSFNLLVVYSVSNFVGVRANGKAYLPSQGQHKIFGRNSDHRNGLANYPT